MKPLILATLIVLAVVSSAFGCETCYQNECSLTLMSGECNCRLKTGNCIGDVCGLQWCITYGGSCDWWAYCPDDGGSGGTPPPIRRKVVTVEGVGTGISAELTAGMVRAMAEERAALSMTTKVAGLYVMGTRNRLAGVGEFITVGVADEGARGTVTTFARDGDAFVVVPITSTCTWGGSLIGLEEYARCSLGSWTRKER